MAFPITPLDVRVELQLAGAWTDVTDDVYLRDPITITRGRADEAARVEPSKCGLLFNNGHSNIADVVGRYSPRNPNSDLYGLIGRNTPVRASVPATTPHLWLPGASGDRAATPDAAALDITGDIDIRLDAATVWQNPGGALELAGKYATTGNQRSWRLTLSADSTLTLTWSTTGADLIQVSSTAPVPHQTKHRGAVRATLDVNNGSGGRTVTFYTADTLAGSWTQLGDPVTATGTTSIFASTAALQLGDISDLTLDEVRGRVYAFELRSGIGGSAVANPDFTAQTPGATSFADAAGRTWTLAGNAEITDRNIRLNGEVSSWPARWDVDGQDVWVPVEAAGILRRLGQGAKALDSTVRRGITAPEAVAPVAYWPAEDADGSTVIASGLTDGRPMRIIGTPSLASYEGFVASGSLPLVSNSTWVGPVVSYTPTGQAQVQLLVAVPSTGATDGAVVCRIATTGSIRRWDLVYTSGSGGGLNLKAYDDDGTELLGAFPGVGFNGELLRISIEMSQNGSDVDWALQTAQVGLGGGGGPIGTETGQTVGRVTSVTIDPTGNLDDTAVGHVSVHSTITSILDLEDELAGYPGETAGRRIERLCGEQGIPFVAAPGLDSTAAMGTQSVATLLDLLDECADADIGLLYETREAAGLSYRPREATYNQGTVLALDYAADGEVAPPLEPVDDDQGARNDRTVTRRGGSSSRAVQLTGPLSIQAPPDGVGLYDDAVTLNLAEDAQTGPIAGWMLHLGTWDETRYPTVHVDLAAAPHLADDATTVDIRDRMSIANPPAWLPPDTIDLLVEGYTEILGLYDWDLTFTCSPAGPWTVAVVDDAELGRIDTDGSVLASAVTSSATTLPVAVTDGALWTEDSAEMPIDLRLGGEVVTMTAVAPIATDAYGRTVVDGWGSADTGQTWTGFGAGGSVLTTDWAVNSGVGKQAVPVANGYRVMLLGSVSSEHADVMLTTTCPVATGARLEPGGIVLREQSQTVYYLARVEANTSGSVVASIHHATNGQIGSATVPGLTHTGAALKVRAQIRGNTIRMKVWTATTAEPDPWHLQVVDTQITGPGQVGIRDGVATGNTNTKPVVFSTDDFRVISPQAMTVTRSVNGVVKAHTAGTDVRLAQPAYLAL